jgi:RNA polymerase sigma factor (TIGR02999 family)
MSARRRHAETSGPAPHRHLTVVRGRGVTGDAGSGANHQSRASGAASRADVDRVVCSVRRRESGVPALAIGAGALGTRVSRAAHLREVLLNEHDESVTGLIHAWNAGETGAGDRLFALVYGELRSIARSLRRRSPATGDDTMDTTALVHEVYLRLAGASELNVQNRGHFFAVAVRASRQIISNYARNAQALKRGGTAIVEDIDGPAAQRVASLVDETLGERVSALEEALQQLERLHPRPCRVVECRYFGGLSITDTALALNISEATVKRDWALAQAWLHRVLRETEVSDDA